MLVGTETADDAGVYRLRPDLAIVNTVDFFPPVVDDPYLFGQISATNSLSDVYAMGGDPKTCMNIVCFPKGKMDISILGEILKGGADKVKEAGAVIIGGHSIIDDEIKYGMSVTGVVHPDKIFRNVGVQEGDVLILTKPLGTGIITTALKRGKASAESVAEAVTSMTTLNADASFVARKHKVHAVSDVTGFGVLGHAQEMASGSGVTLILESAKLPLLKGAVRLAEKGYITGGCKRNKDYLDDKMVIEKTCQRRFGRSRPRPANLRRLAHRHRQATCRQTRRRPARRRRHGRLRHRLRHVAAKALGALGLIAAAARVRH